MAALSFNAHPSNKFAYVENDEEAVAMFTSAHTLRRSGASDGEFVLCVAAEPTLEIVEFSKEELRGALEAGAFIEALAPITDAVVLQYFTETLATIS